MTFCCKTLVGFAFAMATATAAAGEIETDLNGWRLQQFIQAVDAELGQPFKVIDDAPAHRRAYQLDREAYMVFTVDDRAPHYVQSLQLTGATTKMLPFKGLMLGDSSAKVVAALGQPVRKVAIDEPKVVRYEYPERNYSVEIDEHGRLYSILLNTEAALLANIEDSIDPWPQFEAAVLARDFASLSELLRPDVEISRGGETLSIRRRYSDFVQKPDPDITAALFADKGSVREALQRHAPEGQVRLSESQGIGMVYKFPPDSALDEIVFFPYARHYRAYEITFRGAPPAPTSLGAR